MRTDHRSGLERQPKPKCVRPQPADRRMQLTVAVGAKVPHDLAHQCLTSMPFDSGRAVIFLAQIRRILEFQSTLDVLKRTNSTCRSPVCWHGINLNQ